MFFTFPLEKGLLGCCYTFTVKVFFLLIGLPCKLLKEIAIAIVTELLKNHGDRDKEFRLPFGMCFGSHAIVKYTKKVIDDEHSFCS